MKKKTVMSLIMVFVCLCGFCCSINAFGYGEEYAGYHKNAYQKYTDVPPDYWAYDAINQASAKKWCNGYPDGSFLPEAPITRAEAAKVFVEFLGLELTDGSENSFYDVDADAWYAPYVEAGKDLFPVHTSIQGKTPFLPDEPVTREDTVYALVRGLGCANTMQYVDQSVLQMFSDSDSISTTVKPYFSVALTEGLVSGYPDGTIQAQQSLSRAEFATILLRGTMHGFHDTYQAKIQEVTVYPLEPVEIEIGEILILTARATYTDGRNLDYNDILPYDSMNSGVISLEGNSVTGLKEGTTTIKFNNEYLRSESLAVTVTKPKESAKIKITEYPEESEMDTATIKGIIMDEIGGINLTCNDKDILLNADGSFVTEVPLQPGMNHIEFVVTDQYGNVVTKTVTITKPTIPTIHFTQYKESTAEDITAINGYVAGNADDRIKLFCDGKEVTVAPDGTFTADVTLWTMGKNTITFTASNKYGKRAEASVVITHYEFYKEP